MKRRDFLKKAAFVSTGLIWVPKHLAAQSVATAQGLAAFIPPATGGGGGGGCAYTPAPGFGTGNRTALITIYAVNFSFGGTLSVMVDGSQTGTGFFFGSNTLDGTKAIQFQFGSAIKITELTVYQTSGSPSSVYQQGTWKLQGSNTATLNTTITPGDWTDAGSSFTYAANATNVFTGPSTNSNSWTQYQMLGLSGSTNGGPWVTEVEIKYC